MWAGVPMGVKELVAGRGLARHARVDAVQGRHRRPHRHRSRAAARGGRRARRAHDVAGVRVDELDAHVPARRDPQSVEPGAHAGRLVGRLGRRGRGRHDADLHGKRRRWLDPHPVVVQRAVRLQGRASAGSATPGTSTPASPRCPGRCAARCATRPATSTRSRARPTSTRRRCRSPPVVRGSASLSGAAAARLRGLRAAWSSTLGFAVCDPEVEKRAHEAALALCDDAGIELVDVDFHLPPARAGVEHPVDSTIRRQPSRGMPRGTATRRHAGLARRVRADRAHHRRPARCVRCSGAGRCCARSPTSSTRST